MIPDFGSVPLNSEGKEVLLDREDWLSAFNEIPEGQFDQKIWNTPEGIPVRPIYGYEDVSELDFLDTYSGFPPYLRGPYPTMYVNQPWTIRQYAGF